MIEKKATSTIAGYGMIHGNHERETNTMPIQLGFLRYDCLRNQ